MIELMEKEGHNIPEEEHAKSIIKDISIDSESETEGSD